MNIPKLLKGITAVDAIAYTLFLMALSHYLFAGNDFGTLYLTTVSLFFFGVGLIVDAVAGVNVISITTDETTILTTGKATIQE
jgi:hypothetical protein